MSIEKSGWRPINSHYISQFDTWDVGTWEDFKFYTSDYADEEFANALQAAREQRPIKPTMHWLFLQPRPHRRHETRNLR